jgi:hypothetical protein
VFLKKAARPDPDFGSYPSKQAADTAQLEVRQAPSGSGYNLHPPRWFQKGTARPRNSLEGRPGASG